jgi:DNA-binding transcriptional regulator YdaS (Cro superfamily)
MVSSGTLNLAFGVHHAPKDAPARVLRQIESAAQALAVSIAAGNHKMAYVGACIGKSESYVCRMAKGVRPIPDKLVAPLCAATGSNLLRQFLVLEAALSDVPVVQKLAAMMRAAA